MSSMLTTIIAIACIISILYPFVSFIIYIYRFNRMTDIVLKEYIEKLLADITETGEEKE